MEATNTIYADCHVPVYIMNNVKYKKILKKKIQYKNSNTQTFTNMHISCSVPTRSKDFISMEEGCLAATEASVSEE